MGVGVKSGNNYNSEVDKMKTWSTFFQQQSLSNWVSSSSVSGFHSAYILTLETRGKTRRLEHKQGLHNIQMYIFATLGPRGKPFS